MNAQQSREVKTHRRFVQEDVVVITQGSPVEEAFGVKELEEKKKEVPK